MAERTPFLADNDHSDDYDGREGHITKKSVANAHFKGPIKILTIVISFLCLTVFGLLITSYILLQLGSFNYTYSAEAGIRDLSICLMVNFILSVPTVFIQLPILITIAVNIAMSIVILVFSGEILGPGWPGSSFCQRWRSYPDYGYDPPTLECKQARNVIRITMGVSAGVGIIIGVLILITLLLRLIALVRTRFWEGRKLGRFEGFTGWRPTGFTIQFTLSVLKQEPPVAGPGMNVNAVDTSSRGEEGRLIET